MECPAPALDQTRSAAFARHLLAMLTGGALAPLIGLGHRLGLFEAAALGPATSAELAARTGLQERYVREWLGAVATGGVLDLDGTDRRYVLPAEPAPLLTGSRAANAAPMASMLQAMVGAIPELERCFRDGGGVGRDRFVAGLAAVGAAPGAPGGASTTNTSSTASSAPSPGCPSASMPVPTSSTSAVAPGTPSPSPRGRFRGRGSPASTSSRA